MSLAGALASRVKQAIPVGLRARLARTDTLRPLEAIVWNEEYRSGHWDFLGSRSEMPRYAMIAGYQRCAGPDLTILDIGCGPGIMPSWLRGAGYRRYHGIDLSAAAIAQAGRLASPDTTFETAEAGSYVPPQTFDLIIFNEMLYYMPDPADVLRRYAEYLTPYGFYIVSLWQCRESWRAWRRCRAHVTLLEETRVTSGHSSWHIRLCRPGA